MHDDHDVGGVEQSLTDGERPDDVVGDERRRRCAESGIGLRAESALRDLVATRRLAMRMPSPVLTWLFRVPVREVCEYSSDLWTRGVTWTTLLSTSYGMQSCDGLHVSPSGRRRRTHHAGARTASERRKFSHGSDHYGRGIRPARVRRG